MFFDTVNTILHHTVSDPLLYNTKWTLLNHGDIKYVRHNLGKLPERSDRIKICTKQCCYLLFDYFFGKIQHCKTN
jgi:hypothetical protein